MPDLFAYMLTGRKQTEYSIATTSQMVDIKTKDWAYDILDRLGIPSGILTPIVPSGTETECSARRYAKSLGSTPLKLSAYADTTRSRR